MSSRIRATKPVVSLVLNAVNNNISTGAWTVVTTDVLYASSEVEIFNSTGATLKISQGAPGSETAGLLPYTILQGGSSAMVKMEIKNGLPITVESLDNASVAGILVMNLFG